MPAPALKAAVSAANKKVACGAAWETMDTDQKLKNHRFQRIAIAAM